MAINKKLIHFKNKENFDNEVANGNILDSSIVFILDTQLIYTHGTFYDGSTIDVSDFVKAVDSNEELDEVETSLNTLVIPITWANLKDLRDNSLLIPGVLYRITNYMTTTTLANTRSAGHQFDLLVLATSSNTLSEEAKAIRHSTNLLVTCITLLEIPYKFYFKEELVINDTTYFAFECPDAPGALALTLSNPPVIGDIVYLYMDNEIIPDETYIVGSVELLESEYFINNNANVSAWKIWYCLDNDKKRFPWAMTKMEKSIVTQMSGSTFTAEYVGTYEYEGVTYHRWDASYQGFTVFFLTESDNPQVGDAIPVIGIVEIEYVQPDSDLSVLAVNEANENGGYGVIYRMIDEHNNDVPYDFKNILFIRKLDSNGNISTTDGTDTFLYTFSFLSGSNTDASFNTQGYCINNFILSYLNLNNIVLISDYNYTNIAYNNFNNCSDITFINPDIYNTIINNSGNLVITNKSDRLNIEGIDNETLEIPSNLINSAVRIAYDSNRNIKIYCLDDLVNLSNYYTKTEVDNKYNLINLSNYYTKEEVDTKTDLSNYYTKSEIDTKTDLSNYYTKTEVDTKYKIAMVSKGTSDTTFSLLPNTFYKWGTVSSLTLTLTNPTDTSIYNEYMFEFKSGNTPTVLSLPSTILWTSSPFIEANKTYQCSILNNIGVIIAV